MNQQVQTFAHQPVMVQEVLAALAIEPGGKYIDCTLGGGGHATAILESTQGAQVLGIDADPDAVTASIAKLAPFAHTALVVHGDFIDLEQIAQSNEFLPAQGVLFDLGLSSNQLERENRGFSFASENPLDMRFDPDGTLTAALIVNTYSADQLASILSRFGEERRARAIARAITHSRPIESTGRLAKLVEAVSGGRRGRVHPATRTFRALRIAVNAGLDNRPGSLEQAIGTLNPGGRLVVISYHSLEDRIVKETMSREARDCICPPRIPVCVCGHVASVKLVSRKVIPPSQEEIRDNPRSRSARLRVAERLRQS